MLATRCFFFCCCCTALARALQSLCCRWYPHQCSPRLPFLPHQTHHRPCLPASLPLLGRCSRSGAAGPVRSTCVQWWVFMQCSERAWSRLPCQGNAAGLLLWALRARPVCHVGLCAADANLNSSSWLIKLMQAICCCRPCALKRVRWWADACNAGLPAKHACTTAAHA